MSGQPLHLDWRDMPTTDELLERMHRLLDIIDQKSQAPIVLSGSLTGTPGARLVLVNNEGQIVEDNTDDTQNTRRMFVFKTKSTKKRAVDYLCNLAVVAGRLFQDIDKGVPISHRLFGYYWSHSSISTKSADSLANDIALTINVHPYALGIIPEVDGRLSVPKGWMIECQVVHNVYQFADNDLSTVETLSLRGPLRDTPIPPLVLSLKVQRRAKVVGMPQAIVICEHKNIKHMMEALASRRDQRFDGLFLISTGGFSDRGTREFLRLLTQDPLMQGLPCIFISDHDPHAIEIFSNLKYGSRQCAYESRITAVNEIRWAGVSITRYKALANDWPARALKLWIKTHPSSTMEQQVKELALLVTKTQKSMVDSLKSPSARLNTADKNRMKHFHKHEVFSAQYENDLYQDLQLMGMNPLGSSQAVSPYAVGQKFCLAKLSQLNPYGIEECFLAIMHDFAFQNVTDINVSHSCIDEARASWINAGIGVDPAVIHEVDYLEEESATQQEIETSENSSTALAPSSSTAVDPVVFSQSQDRDWATMLATEDE